MMWVFEVTGYGPVIFLTNFGARELTRSGDRHSRCDQESFVVKVDKILQETTCSF